jgi:hypothetical protein
VRNSLDLDGIELRFEPVDFTWNPEYRLPVLEKTISDYTDVFSVHVIWLEFRDNRAVHTFAVCVERLHLSCTNLIMKWSIKLHWPCLNRL